MRAAVKQMDRSARAYHRVRKLARHGRRYVVYSVINP